MKKRIFRYIKHIVLTILVLGPIGILFGLYHGAGLHYGDNPLMMDWDKEGPYIFIRVIACYKSTTLKEIKMMDFI